MQQTNSADGTTIAYEVTGSGRPVVIVGGAFSTAEVARDLAARLAERGLAAVAWDRRARGGSGDTRPYAPEREVDDLAAVIEAVRPSSGEVAVIGHSSGAVLTLLAASTGLPIDRLFLSEPPFRYGVDEPAPDLAERMQRAVDEGRPEDAVTAFQLEGVGLPEPVVQQIRQSPMFVGLVPLAQSAVYDAALVASVSMPTSAMLGVSIPTLVMRGERTMPLLVTAADRLAGELPDAELRVSSKSLDHRLDPDDTAEVLVERLG
jgi:pimeloyl-ACP methyl ester carboxylesterase